MQFMPNLFVIFTAIATGYCFWRGHSLSDAVLKAKEAKEFAAWRTAHVTRTYEAPEYTAMVAATRAAKLKSA